MIRNVVFALAFLIVSALASTAFAEDAEVQDLKRRIGELEKKVGDGKFVTDEPGHKKLHPVHSVYGLTFSGGITVSGHGIKRESIYDPKGEGAFSADLVVESPVGENGRAVVVFDFQRGAGMNLSPVGTNFATSPNGATTGYNADIEGFNDTSVHITQAYYEHAVPDTLTVTVGQLDITGYFDANEFANDERSQFMAPVFVNNPAIEFGGSEDFYALGARATFTPDEHIALTLGVFEGDGDYTETFDRPFYMVEADFALKPFGRDGNYRIYSWYRGARPDEDPDTAGLQANNVMTPGDTTLLDESNMGLGISIDQMLSDTVGVWLRAGLQREEVAQFDKFVSVGLNLSGELFDRDNDKMGIGYAASFMSKGYEDYLKGLGAFESAPEHYIELYYNYALEHAGPDEGFHISPDLQYVVNPGGDKNSDGALIYGIRLQTYF